MNDLAKVKPTHTQRAAFVYIRQSSPTQVEHNRESTARQYALVEKALELGWAKQQVTVIDELLALTNLALSELNAQALSPEPRNRHSHIENEIQKKEK